MYANRRPCLLFGRGTSTSKSLSSIILLNASGSWKRVKLVFTSRAGAGAGVGLGVGLGAQKGIVVLASFMRTWNHVGLLIYACLAALACFHYIEHSLAYTRYLPLQAIYYCAIQLSFLGHLLALWPIAAQCLQRTMFLQCFAICLYKWHLKHYVT